VPNFDTPEFAVLNYTGILPTSQPTLAPEVSTGSTNYTTAFIAAIMILLVVIGFGLFRENRQCCRHVLPCCGPAHSKAPLSKLHGHGSILGIVLSRNNEGGSGGFEADSLVDELAALGVAKAYVIQRNDLLLDARPFAQGAGGQVPDTRESDLAFLL